MDECRCYIDGVEIDQLNLKFLEDEDWFDQFLDWLHSYPAWEVMYVVTNEDPTENPDTLVSEIWVGEMPEERRDEIPIDRIKMYVRNKKA